MDFELLTADSVSIVVVNYNAGSILTDCVVEGLKQAKEVIVVDNASTDNSIEELESIVTSNSRLEIIRNNENLGFATACNIGSEVARSDYLLYLNPDSLLQENTVTKLVAAFELGPKVGMTGGLLINPEGTEQGGGRRAVPTPWRTFVRAFGLTYFSDRWPKIFFDFHLHKEPLPDGPIEVEAISGACMMIKRETMQLVGHWDEEYFLHCEDLDLCMRLRQKGLNVVFVPDAPVIHYLGVCSRKRPIFVEWHKHKGMMKFYKKFFRHQYPGFFMWIVGAGVWFRFFFVATSLSLRNVGRWSGFGRR